MLLIAASQAFMSLMNVSVKKLNSIDPPVPAFEVCVPVSRLRSPTSLVLMAIDPS